MLARVRRQVEELRMRCGDIEKAALAKRFELAPAVVMPRVVRLGVGGERRALMSADYIDEAGPLHSRRNGCADEIEQGRHDIDHAYLRRHPAAFECAIGRPQDERDVRRGIVDEKSVAGFLVLAEAFPMIGEEGDDRAVGQLLLVEPAHDAADQAVDPGDFAVVSSPANSRVAAQIRFRRVVRRVRIVQVDPAEEPLIANALHPRQRLPQDLVAAPLHRIEADLLVFREIEIVKVAIEALPQPPA